MISNITNLHIVKLHRRFLWCINKLFLSKETVNYWKHKYTFLEI
jgi:hypothetical protein